MTDQIGLFEHAQFTEPRREHAYCLDDAARGLVVTLREATPTAQIRQLRRIYQAFVEQAQTPDGSFHNRRGLDGSWLDQPTVEDCWGRGVWALGTAIARDPSAGNSAGNLARFEVSANRRAPHSRAMAFAALGAAEVLDVYPDHEAARDLLRDAAALIGSPSPRDVAERWCWPESRLRYANAALPEVLIAAGSKLGNSALLAAGLSQLDWLLDTESRRGHLSITPVGGWERGETRPGFDQQPIEVAHLADACARAFDVTGDSRWRSAVDLCAGWFLGANDAGAVLADVATGGGFDGLERDGRNENQGAESTLAWLSTAQQAQRLHRLSTVAL